MMISGRQTATLGAKNAATKELTNDRVFPSFVLMSGLLLLPLQFVKISIAQPAHLWVLAIITILIVKRLVHVTRVEIIVYALFIAMALFATFATGYGRIKASEQVFKFTVIYPAFFLVGRWAGLKFARQDLPFGWPFLLGFLAAEYLIQAARIPILWQPVEFMHDSLYGTFLERNWLAVYFFGLSYLVFLKSQPSNSNTIKFFLWCLFVTTLSDSKSVMIACGIVLMIRVPGRYALKLAVLAVGIFLYVSQFNSQLTGLNERLDTERGLAFEISTRLIEENPLGYGFGFVESYFSNLDFIVVGLGEGTNSVFAVPLDLFLIAGPLGFLAWLVFFAGLGLRSVSLLAPLAVWSLLNPLHQSELCYFLYGILVSWGLASKYDDQPLASR